LDPKYVFKMLEEESKSKQLPDILSNRKPRRPSRQGYEDGVTLLFKKISAMQFIESTDPIQTLAENNQFSFEAEENEK
jgi:AdoMet-dependent rRNA methyltransferase SPB1